MTTKHCARALIWAVLVTVGQVTGAAAQITWTVTSNADSGPGSLRQAVVNAAPGDTIDIDFRLVSPISLSSGQIVLDKDVTIQGPGANVLTVRNTAALGPTSRVFRVDAGVMAKISGLTISGGNLDNSASGGGIQNLGTLTLSESTVAGNAVRALGGGISHEGAVLTLVSSTVSGNSAPTQYGGGIYIGSLALPTTITNSTISGNIATPSGAGIFHYGGSLEVINSTLFGNGLASQASVTLQNTIIANGGGYGCSSGFSGTINAAYSLIEDGLACVNGTNLNNLTGAPLLGPLLDNGGPTPTHALLAGSPALDAGSDALARDAGGTPLSADQRDARRVGGTAVDIGAFEYHLPPTFTPAPPLTLVRGSVGGQRVSVGTALQGGAPVVSGGQIAGGTWTGNPFNDAVIAGPRLEVTVPAVSCWKASGTVRFRVVDDNGAVGDGDLQVNVVPSTTGACDCPAGSYDDGTSCVLASPGFFVSFVGQLTQTACSAGTYQPLAGQTSCLLADVGNYVPFDASAAQSPCRLGTYQPNTGATNCKDSSPGFFVDTLEAIAQIPCQPGYYQPNSRQTSCLPADPGTFVSVSAAIAPTACALGRYQPNAGATSCLLASPGYYVDFLAAAAPLACSVGKYQPNAGASSCLLADPGFYVPSPAASAQIQCPVGTTSAAGAGACTLVAFTFTGFFQPVDNLPTLNVVSAGRGIPVKFGLGGNQGLNIFAAGSPASSVTTCGTTASDDVEETVATGTSALSYDPASDRYTYTWKTDKAWANTCRTLTLRFTDGTVRQVNFKFKK